VPDHSIPSTKPSDRPPSFGPSTSLRLPPSSSSGGPGHPTGGGGAGRVWGQHGLERAVGARRSAGGVGAPRPLLRGRRPHRPHRGLPSRCVAGGRAARWVSPCENTHRLAVFSGIDWMSRPEWCALPTREWSGGGGRRDVMRHWGHNTPGGLCRPPLTRCARPTPPMGTLTFLQAEGTPPPQSRIQPRRPPPPGKRRGGRK